MPKPTFDNLDPAKAERFLAIALEEFADHDYAAASVTRIVARAGIAKGSVYQYFDDKQDLFLHLLDVSAARLMSVVSEAPPTTGDVFDQLRWQMSQTAVAAFRFPVHARLVERAPTGELPFSGAVLDRARALRASHFRELVRRGQSDGQLNPSLDPDLAALTMDAVTSRLGELLTGRLGHDVDWAGHPEVERVFDQAVAVLRHGVAAAPD